MEEGVCAIVTQAWSQNSDGTPGEGNEVLAKVAMGLQVDLGVPVVFQPEVYDAVEKPTAHCFQADPPKGVVLGKSSREWNTRTVAWAQMVLLEEMGIPLGSKILVVAHPVHMWRACAVYSRLGMNPVPAEMPESGYGDPFANHFVARGEEWWRLPIITLREKLATILFWYRGYI